MTAFSATEGSREALAAILGPEALARAEAIGRSAPSPSPELVEQVRHIFMRAERTRTRAAERTPASALQPQAA